ncbi:MAG TPA: ferredoxin [Chloroflexota bacterium]|nr:ferredoxin [Chloroflexota bacterium]
MAIKVEIDTSLCEGNGTCARLAPEIFVCSPYGSVIMERVPDELKAKALLAAKQCPTYAIRTSDD